MTSYFLRRLMLVPITFVAITFIVYTIQRKTPGGPIEQAKLQMMGAAGEAGRGGSLSQTGELQIPQEAIDQLKRYYKLDKPIVIGYLIWLGAWPDDAKDGRFSGILQGDFGKSHRYSEPVLDTIVSRFPVSIYFGLIAYIASWVICIPLGITKALRHRTPIDTATSIVVFLGYAIPGFVVALLLLVAFATDNFGMKVLPLAGFRSPEWDERWARGDWWWCIKDQVEHTIIPLIGWMLGSFATMTILMKNSLLENLGADYVRTAFAKGLPQRRVVFVHALRNSLIPLLVGIGHALGLLFAGAFLIERTCNINGMGLLGFMSLIERDYPVLMGLLVFLVLIALVGNIISDLILALVDPRVRFR